METSGLSENLAGGGSWIPPPAHLASCPAPSVVISWRYLCGYSRRASVRGNDVMYVHVGGRDARGRAARNERARGDGACTSDRRSGNRSGHI